MSGRGRALIVIGGLAAAGLASVYIGLTAAGMILLATLCFVAFGRPIIGDTQIRPNEAVDPKEIRAYRQSHRGATITEAVAATQR
ncbi:hypothetical protein [Curtobacterium sp. RRHDQ10]|uniref:hypothetical protein n=1 Tax=Curtobacterium phyllosphaerae TaxID=3413379 RepID=UPI003BF177C8